MQIFTHHTMHRTNGTTKHTPHPNIRYSYTGGAHVVAAAWRALAL